MLGTMDVSSRTEIIFVVYNKEDKKNCKLQTYPTFLNLDDTSYTTILRNWRQKVLDATIDENSQLLFQKKELYYTLSPMRNITDMSRHI